MHRFMTTLDLGYDSGKAQVARQRRDKKNAKPSQHMSKLTMFCSPLRPKYSYPPLPPPDLGISAWGRDFDPGKHAEVVQKAESTQYCPTVDIFLPVCNEPTNVLANTWRHICELDYPHLAVYVLDDGAKEEVRHLAALHGFSCKCLAMFALVLEPNVRDEMRSNHVLGVSNSCRHERNTLRCLYRFTAETHLN